MWHVLSVHDSRRSSGGSTNRWGGRHSQILFPLQLVLRQLLILGNMTAQGLGMSGAVSAKEMVIYQDMTTLMQYSLIVVSSVPLLMVYPIAQRYLTKGLMIGSLKE